MIKNCIIQKSIEEDIKHIVKENKVTLPRMGEKITVFIPGVQDSILGIFSDNDFNYVSGEKANREKFKSSHFFKVIFTLEKD